MSKKPVVIIFKESLAESIIADAATFGFMLLCIWASQGSTWWTFATGAMFLLFVISRVAQAAGAERTKRFYSFDEMREWLDRQEAA